MKHAKLLAERGFTLVEMAMVLVIIGLLLGGILKGQELIYSAKARAVGNELRDTATMISAYQERFRSLPGDDKSANSHLSGVSSTQIGNGDGSLDGNWDSTTTTDESALIWLHLRRAKLASGSTDLTGDWEPRGAEGGRLGVTTSSPYAATNMSGRLFVCQNNVSGRIAQQVDASLDDGKANSGSVQFGNSTAGSSTLVAETTVPVPEGNTYTLCSAF